MAGEALPDIFLRFSNEGGDKTWHRLVGESVDAQCPGDPYGPDDGNNGWFLVTNFKFSVNADAGSSDGGGGGGAAGGKGGGGTAGAKASDKGIFKGVSVTMPLQYGCIHLMEECVKWAQKHQKQQHYEKIPKADFRVRRAGLSRSSAALGSGQDYFMEITLQKVAVEDYSMASSCDQETFTLNYEDMQVQYWAVNPDTGDLILDKQWANVHWSNSAKDIEVDDTDS
jgi:hypothetical protein